PHKAKGFTSGIDESQKLYDAVREKLISKYPLISIGWMNHDTPLIDWTEPNMAVAGQNIIDLGATALVMMPIGFATENHETLLDVDHIIHSLRRKNPHVSYVQMDCVNDHPEFMQMVADWADAQIQALLEATPLTVDPALREANAEPTHSHGHHNHGHHSHSHHSHNHHDHHGPHGHDHHSHDHSHNHPEAVSQEQTKEHSHHH
ncbi:MAG: ferrochelatase, partial [Cyanobacteria bacterium J06623_5]